MKDQLRRLDPLSRREFAANTARTALGLSLLPGLDSAMAQSGKGGKAKHLIYFYMGGGMTHIDSFDPKPDAPTEIKGPIGSIGTNVPGIQLGAYFEKLSKRADKLAIINSMTQQTGDHDGGRYWMLTGYKKVATIVHPEMAAWKQRFHGPNTVSELPSSFIVGGGVLPGAGFFGPSYSPLPLGDPTRGLPNAISPVEKDRAAKRTGSLETFNKAFESKFSTTEVTAYTEYYDNTLSFLRSKDLEVFDLSKVADAKRQTFGMDRMGQGALLASRLVQKGVGAIRIDGGGCDNHEDIETAFQNPARSLDTALSALIDELESIGKLEETLIVVGTEFGRTPIVNVNAGRDHFPRVFSAVLAGGGIKGGQKYGKSDAKAYSVEENPVRPEDLNATIAMALGIPLDKVIYAPSGRPFLVAGHIADPKDPNNVLPEGKPIMKFFA